jgi:hypothetical protein
MQCSQVEIVLNFETTENRCARGRRERFESKAELDETRASREMEYQTPEEEYSSKKLKKAQLQAGQRKEREKKRKRWKRERGRGQATKQFAETGLPKKAVETCRSRLFSV